MRLVFNVLTGQFELLSSSILPSAGGALSGDIDFGGRSSGELFMELGTREEDGIVDQGTRV